MAKKEFSRREFARSGLALTGLGLSVGLGCKTTNDSSDTKAGYPYSQPVTTTRSRKNVFSLDRQSPDIVFYRAAVEAMRQRDTALGNLDGADPLSWEGQANIHEQSCPHGNWFFLPWHRAYLDYFERIIQYWVDRAAEGGNEQINQYLREGHRFALPYWDWTHKKMPDFMLEDEVFNISLWKNAAGEDLYLKRIEDPEFTDDIMGEEMVKQTLAVTDFEIFGSGYATKQRRFSIFGMLEGKLHNPIHMAVGGEMEDLNSPRDPIFWMHHANVDRLWAEWQGLRGDQGYPKGDDFNAWKNFRMDGFFDTQGVAQTVLVEQMLNTFTLGYTYDTVPDNKVVLPGQAPVASLALAGQQVESGFAVSDSFVTAGNITRFSLGQASRFSSVSSYIDKTATAEKRVNLKVRNLPVPTQDSSVRRLKFYLAGIDGKRLRYLFSFGFFGFHHGGGEHAHDGITLHYEITGALQMLLDPIDPLNLGGKLRIGIAMLDSKGKARSEDVKTYTAALQSADLVFDFSNG